MLAELICCGQSALHKQLKEPVPCPSQRAAELSWERGSPVQAASSSLLKPGCLPPIWMLQILGSCHALLLLRDTAGPRLWLQHPRCCLTPSAVPPTPKLGDWCLLSPPPSPSRVDLSLQPAGLPSPRLPSLVWVWWLSLCGREPRAVHTAAPGAKGMGFSGAAVCPLGAFPSSAQSPRAEQRSEVVFMLMTGPAKGPSCRQVQSTCPLCVPSTTVSCCLSISPARGCPCPPSPHMTFKHQPATALKALAAGGTFAERTSEKKRAQTTCACEPGSTPALAFTQKPAKDEQRFCGQKSQLACCSQTEISL